MTFKNPALQRAVIALGVLSVTARLAVAAPDPEGRWAREDGSTRIRIAPCGAGLCAVNTWVRDPHGQEKEGDVLEMTLSVASASELKGEAHDRRRDMTFSITLSFWGDEMRTHGCILFGILCKSAVWHRIR